MLQYAFLFLIVALVAALLGFWGIVGLAADIAKLCFSGLVLRSASVWLCRDLSLGTPDTDRS